jgi:drug/metabolite transporter (DMT)-like permease
MSESARVKWVLALGVFCISFPAILVRYTDAPPLAAAFWRKGMAAAILLPLALAQWRRGRLDPGVIRSLLPGFGGTGFLLAIHFALWFFALKMTTVASAVVLVNTVPIWAALVGRAFLHEKVPRRDVAAIIVSFAGVALLAWGDWDVGPRALLGDALTLVSAICCAGYMTAGRHVRDRLPLAQWLLGIYAAATLFLGAGALVSGQAFWGYDGRTWSMLVLMALVPSTLGHNLLNYAVRHMPAYKVNLCALVEPVVSTVLAAALFAEFPTALFYPGTALIFAGVWMAIGGWGRVPETGERGGADPVWNDS